MKVYHKPKEPTPERYASPSANSIYSSPSELSDNEIPPKPIGKPHNCIHHVADVSPLCHHCVTKVSPINKLSKGRADSRASTIRGYSTMNSLPKVRVSELEKGIKNYGLRKASRHDDLSPLRGQSKQKSKKSKSKSTSGSYKIEIRHHQFLIFHLV